MKANRLLNKQVEKDHMTKTVKTTRGCDTKDYVLINHEQSSIHGTYIMYKQLTIGDEFKTAAPVCHVTVTDRNETRNRTKELSMTISLEEAKAARDVLNTFIEKAEAELANSKEAAHV